MDLGRGGIAADGDDHMALADRRPPQLPEYVVDHLCAGA
jgi:hypothetical protein